MLLDFEEWFVANTVRHRVCDLSMFSSKFWAPVDSSFLL